jgi:hypothetical protein
VGGVCACWGRYNFDLKIQKTEFFFMSRRVLEEEEEEEEGQSVGRLKKKMSHPPCVYFFVCAAFVCFFVCVFYTALVWGFCVCLLWV